MKQQPNLVYILADDMGYGDVSALNPGSRIRTHNLDSMARHGMAFTDAHASSAVCTPSRYSILTGRYNWRSSLKQGVIRGYSAPIIENDRLTVASFLRGHGYRTGCFGKWHLGWDWPWRDEEKTLVDWTKPISRGPTSIGFDQFFGISASLDMPPYVYMENDRATAIPDRTIAEETGKRFWREGEIAPDFRHEEVLQRTTDATVAFIKEEAAAGRPFFAYVPLSAPHTPILPAAEFVGQSNTNAYGDFCLQVDDVVGQIREVLQETGVAEDTILVFTSDNGCSPAANFGELHAVGHQPSYVFRGHKADIYEGGHRVPFLVEWPKRITAGTICAETTCLVDLIATMAEILEDELPDDAGEDSVSMLSLLEEQEAPEKLREATIHHSINGSFAIRMKDWKLEMCPGSGGWSHPKPGPECEGLPPIQLYDLSRDVGEQRNLVTEETEVIRRMVGLLNRYVREGRSTPGAPQQNYGGSDWPQLWWLDSEERSLRKDDRLG